MSFAGAIQSIGKAFNTGMNIGSGRGFSSDGIGTVLTMGALGAGIGAATGAISGSTNMPSSTGAMIGGAIGASAVPLAGATVGAVGAGIVGTAKIAPSVMGAVGGGIISASPVIAGVGAKAGAKIGSTALGFGSKLINWDIDADTFSKVRLSGPIQGFKSGKGLQKISNSIINGKNLIGGMALIEGMRGAWGEIESSRMGSNMGVQTMTPSIPSYSDNAGATGDLVFALNANRRG